MVRGAFPKLWVCIDNNLWYAPGKAFEYRSTSAGRYVAVEGLWERGRQVPIAVNFNPDYQSSIIVIATHLIENAHCQVLQLQHATRKRYLTVPTGITNWAIRDAVDAAGAYIQSGSAGSSCPASPAAAVSERFGMNSWQYGGHDGSWHEAGDDITVTCETPNRCI